MIVKDIPPIIIFWKVYELAKMKMPKYPNKRGRKGYPLPVRIAILAFMALYHLTPEQCVKEMEETRLYEKLGIKKMPGKSTLYRWRKQLVDYIHRLLEEAFFIAYEHLNVKELTIIADGSGVKIGRGTPYYEWRKETLRKRNKKAKKKRKKKRWKKAKKKKRRKFIRTVISYVPELDMIFCMTATPSSVGEIKAFVDGHLNRIVSLGIFKRFIADRLFDAEYLLERLVRAGIEVCVPARKGKLSPKPGTLRFMADKNYERMKKDKHLRSLVESAYASKKSRALPFVTSRLWESRETETVIYGLIFNVARLHKYGLL